MLDKTLEIARGLAALSVFLFHIREMVTAGAPWLDQFAAQGSSGVTLFFVISGYCMFAAASSTQRHERTTWSFFKRRLRRIYPPFWASVVVVILLPFILEAISVLKTGTYSLPSPAWYAFSIADWGLLLTLLLVFFSPGGDLQGAFNPVNSVYWTLAIEVQFYLVIALSLQFHKHWKIVLVVVTIVSLTFLSHPIQGTGLFLPFWPAFATGLALRWLHELDIHACTALGSRAIWLGSIGFVSVLATFAFFHLDTQLAFAIACATALWFAGVFEPIIVKALSSKSRHSLLFRIPLKVALLTGACSYSLYLLHGKLYQLPWMFSRQVFDSASFANLATVIGLTIALCYAFYIAFERPFMSVRYRNRLQD